MMIVNEMHEHEYEDFPGFDDVCILYLYLMNFFLILRKIVLDFSLWGTNDANVEYFDDQDEDVGLDWEAEDDEVIVPYWKFDIRLPLNNETLEPMFWEHDEHEWLLRYFSYLIYMKPRRLKLRFLRNYWMKKIFLLII